jgi:hypothetical protein
MSCILVYYDMLVLSPTHPFICQRDRVKGRFESIIIIYDLHFISTYLLYKIYLLYSSGYGSHNPDPLAKWTDYWCPRPLLAL